MSNNYWTDAIHSHNFNYPYIAIPNGEIKDTLLPSLDNEKPSRVESDIIRHSKCEKNLIRTSDIHNNTILKIFEGNVNKNPNTSFVNFFNSYFGNKNEIPDDFVKYTSYTYYEIAEFSQKLSKIMRINKFYTKSNHDGKPLNIIATESSQSLESVITFLASYNCDFTNLLIDEKSTGDEIYKILVHAEIETLFCSSEMILKLIKYIKTSEENNNDKTKFQKFSKLKLTNIIFYQSSNKVDEEVFEFSGENSISEFFFWNLINKYESQDTNLIDHSKTTVANPSTPAVIIYSKHSINLHENKSVMINHQGLINKILGYFIYFQKTLLTKSKEIFALGKSLFNLDSLCLFLLGMYINSSIFFLESQTHLLSRHFREKVRPSLVHLDNSQFFNLFNKIVESPLDNINAINTKIQISNKLGNSIKIFILPNQNDFSHFKLIKIKSVCPFQLIISQGYREETIGSVIFSFINNLISGNFGLILPCYEAKIVLNPNNLKSIEKLDKSLNTLTGNLYLRSEALFCSYYRKYYLNSYENELDKYDLNFIKFIDSNKSDDHTENLKWLVTNQVTILSQNLSFKILDKYEDIFSKFGIKKILNFSFLKSFVTNKEIYNLINDIEISSDENSFELNIFYKVDEKNWENFLENILRERIIEFDIKEFVGINRKSGIAVIYDKYENLLNTNENDSYVFLNKEQKCLRDCVSKWIQRNLEGNHVVDFIDISKIIIIK